MRKWLKKWATTVGATSTLVAIATIVVVPLALAATFVQGFSANDTLEQGTVVALSQADPTIVIAAPASDLNRIYGVVTQAQDAPVVVSRDDKQVLVATDGKYSVLASVRNGAIRAGDYLSLSATDGIAAKASQDQAIVLGRALSGFDGQKDIVRQEGGFNVGQVLTAVAPGENPLKNNPSSVPPAIRELSREIAGREVSPVRIYAAMVVFAVAALSAVSLLVVSVRNGMVAIGRNPLSRSSIFRSLMQVALTAGVVFLVGVLAVYLILKV